MRFRGLGGAGDRWRLGDRRGLILWGLNEPKGHGERRDGGLRGVWGHGVGDRSGELKHSCNVFQPC